MYSRCTYMSLELDDMEERETTALNKPIKSIDQHNINILTNNNSISRSLSWKDAVKQSVAAIIAHSLVIQAGINMAYSAVLLPQLFADDTDIKITMSESTWIASIVTLALPPGALAVGPLMDKFGRKKVCMLTSLPFMCSWILQSRSTEVWHMYLARILAGIAAGLSTVSTVYVSEIAHPNFRPMLLSLNSVFVSPMLLSLNSVFVSFGILITCVFGALFDWRTMALIYCGISAFSFCALFFVPESPHWLVSFKNDTSSAAKSLKWTYPKQAVFEAQYDIFIESRQKPKVIEPVQGQDEFSAILCLKKLNNYVKIYRDATIYKPLAILFTLFCLQQLSGCYVIIFYAVDLFRKIGGGGDFQRGIDAFVALVLFGTIRFVMSIVATILSKKIGRRTLLMTSGVGMSLTSLNRTANSVNDIRRWDRAEGDNITLICVLGYVCFSAIGFLMIPWTLVGELLPVRVRGVLSGVLVAIAYVFMFGIVKVFPYVLERFRVQVIFFGISSLNLIAVLFVFVFVPETFGKTFAEIERYFIVFSDTSKKLWSAFTEAVPAFKGPESPKKLWSAFTEAVPAFKGPESPNWMTENRPWMLPPVTST
ncbi:Sugar transporter [Popillia japonica]|uniref:Sugar transporter n=1 Tax=Popillia japonica TaxID=7064 RepID=A0AAW1N6K5_POPJA